MNDYPNLKNLCRTYLNQDFDLEFGSADNAIRIFFSHQNKEDLAATKKELEKILSGVDSEEILRFLILEQLQSSYHYPAEWPDAKTWLEHVNAISDE